MKRAILFSAIAISLIVFIAGFSLNYASIYKPENAQKPFYVGVTFCGNTTAEAKLLIDRVKSYTNLFVLQSGPLQEDRDAIDEICDYAVSSGMYVMVYFGTDSRWFLKLWLDTYDGRWGDRFLGVYFGDELGGKMLDDEMRFFDQAAQSAIFKMADGSISGYRLDENTSVTYRPDGRIELIRSEFFGIQFSELEFSEFDFEKQVTTFVTYYPNGTIVAKVMKGVSPPVEADYNFTYTYEELWNLRPFQSYDETTERFINVISMEEAKRISPNATFTAFTSDYALYWFDYLIGYDVMLAQFGWNHTTAQDIALVRGAANLQNKSWGAIITWKYPEPPYLAKGEEIYSQMRTAYECGAEYVVLFNYAEDMSGPYGILQEEHFEALERFWNEVVQNPWVFHGGIDADAVLVLPRNYGWGMRNPADTIWGLWRPDEKSPHVWMQLWNSLKAYGLRLDIVYDDPEYPVTGKYSQIRYWNQTG
jgi:hypothetical protein